MFGGPPGFGYGGYPYHGYSGLPYGVEPTPVAPTQQQQQQQQQQNPQMQGQSVPEEAKLSPRGNHGSRSKSPFQQRSKSPYTRTSTTVPSSNHNSRGSVGIAAMSPPDQNQNSSMLTPRSHVSGYAEQTGQPITVSTSGPIVGGEDITHQKYEWALRHLDNKEAELTAVKRRLEKIEFAKEQNDRALAALGNPGDLNEAIARILAELKSYKGLQGSAHVSQERLHALEAEVAGLRYEKSQAINTLSTVMNVTDDGGYDSLISVAKQASEYVKSAREDAARSGNQHLKEQLESQVSLSERLQSKVQELTVQLRERSEMLEKYRTGVALEQDRQQSRIQHLEHQLTEADLKIRNLEIEKNSGSVASADIALYEEKYRSAMRSLSRTTDESATLQKRLASMLVLKDEYDQCYSELVRSGLVQPERGSGMSPAGKSPRSGAGAHDTSGSSGGTSTGALLDMVRTLIAGSVEDRRFVDELRSEIRKLKVERAEAIDMLASKYSEATGAAPSMMPTAGSLIDMYKLRELAFEDTLRAMRAELVEFESKVQRSQDVADELFALRTKLSLQNGEMVSLRQNGVAGEKAIAELGGIATNLDSIVRRRGLKMDGSESVLRRLELVVASMQDERAKAMEQVRELSDRLKDSETSKNEGVSHAQEETGRLRKKLDENAAIVERLQHEQRQCIALLNVYMPANIRDRDTSGNMVDILKVFLKENEQLRLQQISPSRNKSPDSKPGMSDATAAAHHQAQLPPLAGSSGASSQQTVQAAPQDDPGRKRGAGPGGNRKKARDSTKGGKLSQDSDDQISPTSTPVQSAHASQQPQQAQIQQQQQQQQFGKVQGMQPGLSEIAPGASNSSSSLTASAVPVTSPSSAGQQQQQQQQPTPPSQQRSGHTLAREKPVSSPDGHIVLHYDAASQQQQQMQQMQPQQAQMQAQQAVPPQGQAAGASVLTADEQMAMNRNRQVRGREDTFHVKYELRQQLGYGTFSTVNLCVERATGREFAVKIVDVHQQNGRFMPSFRREVEILKIVNHKFIVKLQEVIETTDTLYIITDLLRGGDVLNRLEMYGKYSENDAKVVIKKVLEATAYLHSQGIIHRDLKPENILLISSGSATDIKLCDFGHSALGADDKAGFGTYSYLAPEVILNHQGTNAIDLWSIGVILYVLLSGTFPFDSSDDQRMFSEIVHGKYSFPESHWKRVTPTARDLITCLMCVDPKKRYTIQQALRHPWFAGVYF